MRRQRNLELERLAKRLELYVDEQFRITAERLDQIGHAAYLAQVAAEALKEQLDDIQALTARVYEHGMHWREQWIAYRQTPEYELSYQAEPLVTVVVPTYNRAETLISRSLPSLRRQTYTHWEAKVIGDGSTDNSGELVRSIHDARINWENLLFRGPYPQSERQFLLMAGMHAVRRAHQLANGHWLASLDDDDEWDDDHLEVLVAEALRSKAEFIYGRWRVRDPRNGRLINREFGEWPLQYSKFSNQCSLWHQGLRLFPPDENTRFTNEPGDWNRARKLWEAGVKFSFIDRAITTIWFTPRDEPRRAHFDWLVEQAGYVEE